jgi:ribonuclease HI
LIPTGTGEALRTRSRHVLRRDEAILEIDGASRGNPGKAGAGFILSCGGRQVARGGRALGTTTNNVAEYMALILGLEKAIELGFRRIHALSDSLLLVRQVEGIYRVRNPRLKVLHRRCMDLIEQLQSFGIGFVPSAENRAHALAEEASSR